jgi:hypothetical protein
MSSCLLVLATAVMVVFGGCFERKEHITIDDSGSVAIELRYKTDSVNEILEGDAMPTPPGGWAVERTTSKDDEGKETIEVLAASFPRNAPCRATGGARCGFGFVLQFQHLSRMEQRATARTTTSSHYTHGRGSSRLRRRHRDRSRN